MLKYQKNKKSKYKIVKKLTGYCCVLKKGQNMK